MVPMSHSSRSSSQRLLDVLIRAGLIAALVIICYRIFHPFLDLMLWSMILAVTLYPLHRKLKPRLGNKDGRTATLIVLAAIAILLVPIYLLGASIAASAENSLALIRSGNLHVPPPADSVAAWPLVGRPLHGFWQQAATDLSGLMQQYAPQIREIGVTVLRKLAGFGVGLLMFIFALVLAGIFMAYGESGQRSAVQAASRFVGPDRGPHIAELCTQTIRAVSQGVIGIAFIQMMLVGLGFVMIGVPGAGLLALGVLLLGIMQIPATLITLPVIVFVLSSQGVNTATIAFSIYVFVAGLVDNVLKPLLLGRGVAVPMPVVLIGALGGMVSGGIIGLFIGPVILGIGYELFWQWVRDQPVDAEAAEPPHAEATAFTVPVKPAT
jgi:predicted PurR-regulated permease PerM